ncbi:MAG: VCBS repeat-containing protein [Planctomycetota bacterium]
MSTALPFVSLALATSLVAQTQPSRLASTSRSFPTGDQLTTEAYRPYEVVLGDFDGDGRADAALAHYGNFVAPKVSWMRNAGDGTFEPPHVLPASGETMDVVAADLDGDGDLDLAYAQSSEGTSGQAVLVYLNDGHGNFGTERRFVTGQGPTGIAAGDLDGDGDVDLVTANFRFNEEDVSVLWNDGTAAFGQRVDLPITGLRPRRVAVGDLNGDGRPEVVASLRNGSPDFAVWINQGQGAFASPTVFAAGFASITDGDVELADLDRDGDLDVLYGAMSNGLTSSIAVFYNRGGQLGAPVSVPTSVAFGTVYDFAVADVTGDGWPDILGTAQSSAYGYVLIPSDGLGGFGAAQVFRSGEMARAIATDDLDGDGDRDIVVVNSGSLTISVHENQGGSFALPPQVVVPAFSSQSDVGDIDGDGDIDLVTASGTITSLTNQGGGTFTAASVAQLGGSVTSIRLRELSGDAIPDLVFLHSTLNVAIADGFGGFGGRQPLTLGGLGREVDAVDADADGDLDLVVAGAVNGTGGVHYLANNGGGAFGPAVFFAASSTSVENHVVPGDFDNDGRADLLTASGSEVRVWLGNGNGTFQAPLVTSLGMGGTNHVTVADFDADGNLDVAGSSFGATFRGEILTIAFGYGDGDFTAPVFVFGMFSLQYGGVGGLDHLDVDGDGDLDIVGGCYGADDVEIFENRGARTFVGGSRYGVGGAVTGVRVADFDSDGAPDLFVNIGTEPPIGGAITLLRNRDTRLGLGDVGAALAGSTGLPTLGATGAARPRQAFGLHLRRALPNTFVALALGATRVDLPLFGGTLVPSPALLVPIVTDPVGASTLAFNWPGGIRPGASLFAQAWVVDPLGPQGYAASNGLRITQF